MIIKRIPIELMKIGEIYENCFRCIAFLDRSIVFIGHSKGPFSDPIPNLHFIE